MLAFSPRLGMATVPALLVALGSMPASAQTAMAATPESGDLLGPYLYLFILAGGGIIAILSAFAADRSARSRTHTHAR